MKGDENAISAWGFGPPDLDVAFSQENLGQHRKTMLYASQLFDVSPPEA